MMYISATLIHRDCVLSLDLDSEICKALLPEQDITHTLLQYVWSLWEDPVDVRELIMHAH